MEWHLKVRRMYGTARWEVLKAWRRRELRKRFPDGKISEHFRYIEFFTKDGTPFPLLAVPGLQRICRTVLEPLRDEFGACYVTSGYRHYAYNEAIGGVADSRHVWDKRPLEPAVDVILARGTPAEWAAVATHLMAREYVGGGIGTYTRKHFVHLDLRIRKARWVGWDD